MIRAYVIDDEKHAINVMENSLKEIPGVKLSGKAENLNDGIRALRRLQPDVLFLDISLPDGQGFDLFDVYNNPNTHTIFYTAHEEFAIRAVSSPAFGYLLKPLDVKELHSCIQKVSALKSHHPPIVDQLAIHTMDGLEFFPYQDVVYCSADNNYSCLHLANGREVIVSKSLKVVEDTLPYPPFLRIHQSFIVNGKYISKYRRSDSVIYLKDGTELGVSQTKKHGLNLALFNMKHL